MRTYAGRNLDLVSFPMGGIGAGMVCLQGNGSLGSVSLRHRPNVRNEPMMLSAVTVLGREPVARVVEAPVPDINLFAKWADSGTGLGGRTYGLPRFSSGEFSSRFPFAAVKLSGGALPLSAELLGWSPFIPGDEDDSSLPFAALEYTFTNTGSGVVDAVYYFCASNFMRVDDGARVRAIPNGFVLEQPGSEDAPHSKGAFCASVDERAYVDAAWFRGGWFDSLTMLWAGISKGEYGDRKYRDESEGESAGGTLAVPFRVKPGESRTIRLHLSWYVPDSDVRTGRDDCGGDHSCGCAPSQRFYRPWYASRFGSVDEANNAWLECYGDLRRRTEQFTDCFYDSSLPEELLEAVAANLSILKSPTVLRQADGRLWGWEGCCDDRGSCEGSCTHVWNYAQAIAHLFPRLERSLRETEFHASQDDETGRQTFRSYLPIRRIREHTFHAASDGQLGGIIKVYRDWRISGDAQWLRGIWPRVKQSLGYCIGQWDTDREGVLKQPHHNTYDIEFWGPDGMCSSFYLGALKAAAEMGNALGEDTSEYAALFERGRAYLERNLFNGEYFHQKVMWKELNESLDLDAANAETRELLEREGPKYQYGTGCLSDGVLGAWLAELSGLAGILDEEKLKKNLESIHRYNFKPDLSAHSNTQRPGYAANHEAGLLLCTWPRGGKPSLPFPYSDEVWTGIEYQAAAHLMMKGFVREGLDIVRGCRARYDGAVRNPYNEYECGHWYARAMASYALLQAYTGVRYDAVTKTLYAHGKGDYKTFLCTATGFGTVAVKDGRAGVKAVSGKIDVKDVVLL